MTPMRYALHARHAAEEPVAPRDGATGVARVAGTDPRAGAAPPAPPRRPTRRLRSWKPGAGALGLSIALHAGALLGIGWLCAGRIGAEAAREEAPVAVRLRAPEAPRPEPLREPAATRRDLIPDISSADLARAPAELLEPARRDPLVEEDEEETFVHAAPRAEEPSAPPLPAPGVGATRIGGSRTAAASSASLADVESATSAGSGRAAPAPGAGVGSAGATGTAALPDHGPRVLERHEPVYPEECARSGQEGKVRCRVEIDALGGIENVLVVQSSGHTLLDQAAVASLRSWRFEPAVAHGVAVPSQLLHRVTFRLDGG